MNLMVPSTARTPSIECKNAVGKVGEISTPKFNDQLEPPKVGSKRQFGL